MKTAIALLIKFAGTLAAAWITFSIFGNLAFYTIFMVAVIATILNYLIGDLLVLPWFGNISAAILDGIMGAAIAYVVLIYYPVTYFSFTPIYAFAIIVAVAEFFFHQYLMKANVVEPKKPGSVPLQDNTLNYNTETGEELHPDMIKSDLEHGIFNVNNSYLNEEKDEKDKK